MSSKESRVKSSTLNRPDERLVYLALKNIFNGEKAKLRTLKAIRKQINQHLQDNEIVKLRKEHNLDHISDTAKNLLESQVFESTFKAKIRFPEVFNVSPAQSADREQSEAAAAKSEADAIKDANEGRLAALEPVDTAEESGSRARQLGMLLRASSLYGTRTERIQVRHQTVRLFEHALCPVCPHCIQHTSQWTPNIGS